LKFLLRILKSLNSGAAYTQRVILIVVSITVTCTMFTEVVARYVFQTPIWGMDEITGHTAVWLYLIGAAYGTYERSHIKAEFANMMFKNPRTLTIIKLVTAAIAAVMAGYMTIWGYGYIYWSITQHEVLPTLMWPTVYFQFPILLGAILMCIYFVVEAVDYSRELHRYRAPASR